MLPFSRILQYDNRLWYTGDELMAWDSSGVSTIMGTSNSINDYTGKTIQNTRFSGSGSTCVLGDPSNGFQYGVGVKFVSGTALYNRTLVPNTWLMDSWTLDYWTYQSGTNTQWWYSQNSIAIGGTAAMLSSGNRFIIGAYYNSTAGASNVGIWNNVNANGSIFIDQSLRNIWCSTSWVHVCIQYDASTNTFYFYENGVLKLTLVYVIQSVNIGTYFCGCSNPGSPLDVVIERYRLRSGLAFSLDGFDLSTLYR